MRDSVDYQNLLKSRGFPLIEVLGINEVALMREDALVAVELLRYASVPILGGDLYVQRGTSVESACTNWFTNCIPGESEEHYLVRSWNNAEKFIKELPELNAGRPLFVFVVGDVPS
jgi:hypothetical protein